MRKLMVCEGRSLGKCSDRFCRMGHPHIEDASCNAHCKGLKCKPVEGDKMKPVELSIIKKALNGTNKVEDILGILIDKGIIIDDSKTWKLGDTLVNRERGTFMLTCLPNTRKTVGLVCITGDSVGMWYSNQNMQAEVKDTDHITKREIIKMINPVNEGYFKFD